MKALLPVILLLVSSGAWAKKPPACSPEKALQATLRGPIIAFAGQQRSVVTMEIGQEVGEVRVQGNGQGRIRHVYQTGAAKGIILLQTRSAVWKRVGSGPWTRLPPVTDSAASEAGDVMGHYQVICSPGETIQGRRVIPIHIVPRQKYNPSRRLWLDPKTGIIVKDQLFAPDGRIRSSTEYMSLRVGPQPGALFLPPVGATETDLFGPASFSPRRSAAEVERESGRPVLLPAHVPQGYRPVLYGIMYTGSGRKMPAVRYFDGIAAFSVFQRGWGASAGMGQRGQGGGACVGQSGIQQSVVTVSGKRSNYLLVGDLAVEELERIARSLP